MDLAIISMLTSGIYQVYPAIMQELIKYCSSKRDSKTDSHILEKGHVSVSCSFVTVDMSYNHPLPRHLSLFLDVYSL